MKRRQLLRYGGASLLTAAGLARSSTRQVMQAQTADSVTVTYLGHTCFLFADNDIRILVNPFRTIGCTAGYNLPQVEADLVLISSYLLDEGAVEQLPGNPRILAEPGDYQIQGIRFQGITIPHDREGGRRFGNNVAWLWNQADIAFLHMGGAAAPIELEQKILMGSPDVALVPVGGGAKAYNPQEAVAAIDVLNPKIVIPTQYLTEAADKENCDLVPVDDFLALTQNMDVSRLNERSLVLKSIDLPSEGTAIRVFNYSV